ncbi:MAG TPA: CPBP family intramembrane glutamic endopeptidase [Candidatus Krumholzibacteria bacterium]|nr:CPBP family intramembrane glutamic endopeptidase [Candidatus Krumholzibacteria bacterium]
MNTTPPPAIPSTPGSGDARRVLLGASLLFAVLLVGGGWLLLAIKGRTIVDPFATTRVWQRVASGAAVGAVTAMLCAFAVRRVSALARLEHLARHAMEGIEPRWHTLLTIALLAGVGEEFFFRGALEPMVGRWVTAAGFVAMHGALRVRNRGGLTFAVFLAAASIGLSAVNAWNGLESAMSAHASYDFAMLLWLSRRPPLTPGNSTH